MACGMFKHHFYLEVELFSLFILTLTKLEAIPHYARGFSIYKYNSIILSSSAAEPSLGHMTHMVFAKKNIYLYTEEKN